MTDGSGRPGAEEILEAGPARPARGRRAALLAAAATVVLAAGTVAAVRAADSPGPRARPGAAGPGTAGAGHSADPGATVPDPPPPGAARLAGVAFAGTDTWYATLATCRSGVTAGMACRARLRVTEDGGRTWRDRALPERAQPAPGGGLPVPVAYGSGTVALDGIDHPVISEDAGLSFVPLRWRAGTPVGRATAGAPLRVCVPGEAGCSYRGAAVLDPHHQSVHELYRPPPVGALRLLQWGARGELYAVGGDRPRAAVSPDGGATWHELDVAPARRPVTRTRLAVSPDGAEVWLLAGHEVDTGHNPLHYLWRLTRGRFSAVPSLWPSPDPGVVAAENQPTSVLAAFAVGTGLVVLDDRGSRWHSTPGATSWTRTAGGPGPRVQWMERLPDGGFAALDGSSNGVWRADDPVRGPWRYVRIG